MEKEKSYHHFVPQFYLRNFSDNKKSIGMFLNDKKIYIPNASIRENFGKKHFYGENDRVENWLAKIEWKWANIISKIISNNSIAELTDEERAYILSFFFLMDARTEATSEVITSFIKKISNDIEIEGSAISDKMKKQIDIKYPSLYMMENLNLFMLLYDLKLILINNKTKRDFISSDSVVVKYNQFLLEKGYRNGYGLATVGTQMFIPISSKLCLCLYDDNIYDVNINDKNILEIKGIDEILRINKIFIYNSAKAIILKNNSDEFEVNKQLRNMKERLKLDIQVFETKDTKEKLYKMPNRIINKNFGLRCMRVKTQYINAFLDFHKPAPMRKGANIINEKYFKQDKSKSQTEIERKLEGKKFYLKK